jgi:hypothetical protein
LNGKYIQAEEKIRAKLLVFNHGRQIPICRRNQSQANPKSPGRQSDLPLWGGSLTDNVWRPFCSLHLWKTFHSNPATIPFSVKKCQVLSGIGGRFHSGLPVRQRKTGRLPGQQPSRSLPSTSKSAITA